MRDTGKGDGIRLSDREEVVGGPRGVRRRSRRVCRKRDIDVLIPLSLRHRGAGEVGEGWWLCVCQINFRHHGVNLRSTSLRDRFPFSGGNQFPSLLVSYKKSSLVVLSSTVNTMKTKPF